MRMMMMRMMHKRITFQKLSTPHDLAMCLGPWILLTLVLGAVVARIWTGSWLCLLVVVFLHVPAIQFFSNYCDALNVKYATEGVRFQGTVIKTWEVSEQYGLGNLFTTVRQVLYRVDDFQYITEFKMSLAMVEAASTTNVVVDLVRLPGYPKSAILATSLKPVKSVDPDFPTQYRDFSSTFFRHPLECIILFTTFFSVLVLCDWTKNLGWPVFFFCIPTILLPYICAYWITTMVQARKWPQLLYGAKQVQDKDWAAPLVSSSDENDLSSKREHNLRVSLLLYDAKQVQDIDWAAPLVSSSEDDLSSKLEFYVRYSLLPWIIRFCIIPINVFFFIREYWITTKVQERKWSQRVYGAKQVQDEEDKDGAAPLVSLSEGHVSHEELRQLNRNQQFSYSTVLRIAVEATLWSTYFGAFAGSYCAWFDLAVPRWERTLLERYASETDISFVVGSVLCERENFMARTEVIVQYKVDNNRLYKKRLYSRHYNKLRDSLELVYLKGLPESATYKRLPKVSMYIDPWKILFSIFVMAFQIRILALIVNTFLETRFLWVAGMLLVCNFFMGLVGVWVHYKTVVEREMLGDAKQVHDGTLMETTPKTVDDTAQV